MLGFLQDFIAVMCLLGIGTFWWIRIVNNPKNQGRKSRFFGSHLGPAYLTLFMIFNVIWTLFLFRGAVQARDMGDRQRLRQGRLRLLRARARCCPTAPP